MKKGNITPPSHFRLPARVKNKLIDLAQLDSIDMTAALVNMINEKHRERAKEISEFKKELKNSSLDDKTEDI